MGAEPPLTSTERSRRRRAALRARGLKPRTFWVPDVNSEGFKEQARRDCEALWAEVERDPEIYASAAAIADEVLSSIPPWIED